MRVSKATNGIQENGLPRKAKAILEPERGYDVGAGRGNKREVELHGGVVGIVLAGRRRPYDHSTISESDRISYLKKWMTELNIYNTASLSGDQ